MGKRGCRESWPVPRGMVSGSVPSTVLHFLVFVIPSLQPWTAQQGPKGWGASGDEKTEARVSSLGKVEKGQHLLQGRE